jgi:hypothetical protein
VLLNVISKRPPNQTGVLPAGLSNNKFLRLDHVLKQLRDAACFASGPKLELIRRNLADLLD